MRTHVTRRQALAGGLALAGLGVVAGSGLRLAGLWSPKVARIGIFEFNPPGKNGTGSQDFLDGLRDLGWVEGQNLIVEVRYGNSTYPGIDAPAAELIALKPDLIFTGIATAVGVLTKATSTIPIVFGAIGDATGGGSVQSLAHPGKNATGTLSLAEGLNQKRLEHLKASVPGMSSVAALRDSAVGGQQWQDVQDAAADMGLTFHDWSVEAGPNIKANIKAVFASLQNQPVDGLVVISGATLFTERQLITCLAKKHRVPAVYPFVEYAQAGGLLAYAANQPDLWRRAATHADKILRGANPGELPVERPTTFDLVINKTTADALGLTIPQSIMAQGPQIIP